MRAARLILLGAVGVLAMACNYDDDGVSHACEVFNGDRFAEFDLDLLHTEPRMCPITVEFDREIIISSGAVSDKGTGDADELTTQVFNGNYQLMQEESSVFEIYSTAPEWRADYYVQYPAATSAVYSRCWDDVDQRVRLGKVDPLDPEYATGRVRVDFRLREGAGSENC